MELVAAGRPFVSFPLATTSSSASTCAIGSTATAPGRWLDYADADPETLARAIADGIASTPRYRSVSGAGAGRAAALIAELL